MNFGFKIIFANRDLLGFLIKPLLSMIPITNALMRTTFAPTMIEGSIATNVLPPITEANINCRILEGETVEEVAAYIQKTVGKRIKVSYSGANNPTPPSR